MIPVTLHLSSLDEQVLRTVIPLPAQENESLEDHIERMAQVLARDKKHKNWKGA